MKYSRIAIVAVLLLTSIRGAAAQVAGQPPISAQTSPWGGMPVVAPLTQLPVVSDPTLSPSPSPFSPPPVPQTGSATSDDLLRLASQSVPQYLRESVVDSNLKQHIGTGLPPSPLPPGTREGAFQKVALTGTWIPSPSGGDLGFTDLDAFFVLGFPFPHRESPLLITPSFGVHYLNGPDLPDLPERLYDTAIEWRHMRQLNERWAMDVAVTTGYYSDFEQSNGDAFRVTGRGLAVFEWSPITKIVLGVAYLNRADALVLPVGGLLITPNDSTKWELVVPRPRIAWRLDQISCPDVNEYWLYVAGEFGGGVWAIERAGGAPDLVESNDYRVLFGLEQEQPGRLNARFEIGYVFSREIEFDSVTPRYEPGDTLLMRFGVTY